MKTIRKQIVSMGLIVALLGSLLQGFGASIVSAAPDEEYEWAKVNETDIGNVIKLYYNNDAYYAYTQVSGMPFFWRSENLVDWTQLLNAAASGMTSINDIAFIGSDIYLTGRSSTTSIMKRLDTDGNWLDYSNFNQTLALGTMVHNGSGQYVIFGGNAGTIVEQNSDVGGPDPDASWSSTSVTSNRFYAGIYNPSNETFYGANHNGSIYFRPSNTTTWSSMPVDLDGAQLNALALHNGQVVAAGNNGIWQLSEYATKLRDGEYGAFYSIIHADNTYVALSIASTPSNGTSYAHFSNDLSNWTVEQTGEANSYIRTIAYGSHGFVAGGSTGILLRRPVQHSPVISTQPASQTLLVGENASFTVAASSDFALTYQWQAAAGPSAEFTDIADATDTTLQLQNITLGMNGYRYRVVVTDSNQLSTISDPAILTVVEPTVITGELANVAAIEGLEAVLQVAATGTDLSYSWQVSEDGGDSYTSVPDQTGHQLVLQDVGINLDDTYYKVDITGADGQTQTSGPVRLTVYPKSEFTPEIEVTVMAGEGAVIANLPNRPGMQYQWQVNSGSGFTNLSNETNASLSLQSVTAAMDGNEYRLLVTGAAEYISDIALLKVNVLTEITAQPVNILTYAGQAAQFQVSASGNHMTYQWYGDTSGTGTGSFDELVGESSATLTLPSVNSSMNNYRYSVVISGRGVPAVESEPVTLSVFQLSELQPLSVTTVSGETAIFAVPPVDPGLALTYQWQVNSGDGFVDVPGANGSALELNNAAAAMDGYTYRVVIGGAISPDYTSSPVELRIYDQAAFRLSGVSTIAGKDTALSITAEGPGLIYMWYVDQSGTGGQFELVDGVNDKTLLLEDVTPEMNGYLYRVIVDGAMNTSYASNTVTLAVYEEADFTAQAAMVISGQDAAFAFEGAGAGAGLTYQWQVDAGSGIFTDIDDAEGTTLQLSEVTSGMNGYRYRVVVGGSMTPVFESAAAELTVLDQSNYQPDGISLVSGETTSFEVAAAQAGLTYQWQVDTTGAGNSFATIDGANAAILELEEVTAAMNGYLYRVIVAGSLQTAFMSEPAVLTVYTTEELQPLAVGAIAGNDAVLAVPAGGIGLTYQWQVDTTGTGNSFMNIDGANADTYELEQVTLDMSGFLYRVIIDGALQSAFTSEAAILIVYTTPDAPTGISAVASSGSAVIHFTAPADNGGREITEYRVMASPGNIVATGVASPIRVNGLTNGTAYTFTVIAVNAAGPGMASNESSPVTPFAPYAYIPSADSGAEVWVNGVAEQAGIATTSSRNGRRVTTITLDESKLEERLAAQGLHTVITIPASQDSEIIIGELNGRMVKGVERQHGTIEIRTSNGTYTLPAGQINIEMISEQFGQSVPLQDISIRIEIAAPSAEDLRLVENSAEKGTFTLVAPPLQFTVTAVFDNRVINISSFDAYVERTIAIPLDLDPEKITTGIVVDTNGSVRHVPTKIVVDEGKYYAVINSLSNSLYAVVWNPRAFSDAAGHWAEAAVNDMGSRMVVSGAGSNLFQPDRDITRAEFAAVMVKALGLKPVQSAAPFSDVRISDWYNEAIATASSFKLINGFTDGTFRPTDNITREQAMSMIASAMRITGLGSALQQQSTDELLLAFQDGSRVADWAKDAVAAVLAEGIVSGRSANLLAPKANVTRAEVAVLVQRLLKQSDLI